MKVIFAAALCIAAIIGQISTASAQYDPQSGYYYYYPPGGYYYYGSPAGSCCALTPQDLGWNYTRNQPVGYVEPYPAARMPDGSLACEHGRRPAYSRLVSARLLRPSRQPLNRHLGRTPRLAAAERPPRSHFVRNLPIAAGA